MSPEAWLQVLGDGGAILGEAAVPPIEPGGTTAGIILAVPESAFDAGQVQVTIDPDDVVNECDETDNVIALEDPR